MSQIRDAAVAAITPLLPAGARLVPVQRSLDVIDTVTLMLKLTDIDYAKPAPLGAWTITYVLTVIHPSQDPATADEALDDIVLDLFEGLQNATAFWPTNAKKVLWDQSRMAYDITLMQNTKKAS